MPDLGTAPDTFDPADYAKFKAGMAPAAAPAEFNPADYAKFKASMLPDVGAPLIGDGGQTHTRGADWANNAAEGAGQTAYKAVTNVPASAWNFAKNTVSPFLHPIDTVNNIADLGVGALQKTGLIPKDEHEKYADAVGKFMVDRYGSLAAARKTLEEDPVGLAGDLSMVLTGGGSAAARLPGALGKVGEVAGAAGRALDPLQAVAPVGRAATNLAGNVGAGVLGVTTGVGRQPFEVAARAGYEGGAGAEAFRDSMANRTPMADVVDEARGAVRQLRQERGDVYRRGMASVGADSTILDFGEINRAINSAEGIKSYKGQSLSPKTYDIRREMRDVVNQWETFDPAEFHTPEGIDALKQKLGDIRDDTQFGTPARVAADRIYNAVRQTIANQVPAYSRVMEGYSQASDLISNIERELSLKPGANVDTALRKLQSVLRNNVHTSYGRRGELADYLVNAGAPHLLHRLAGQALQSWEPRGLSRVLAGGDLAGAISSLAMGHPAAAAGLAASLPTMSPRLMGNAAYGAGAASRLSGPVMRALSGPARQVGQATQGAPFDNSNSFASGGAIDPLDAIQIHHLGAIADAHRNHLDQSVRGTGMALGALHDNYQKLAGMAFGSPFHRSPFAQ